MISLRDCGAKGDGSDDTEAIRAWAEKIKGGHGYVPPGTYCYSGSWSIPAPCRIDGALSVFLRTDNRASITNANMRWTTEVDAVNGGPPIDRDVLINGVTFASKQLPVNRDVSFFALVGVARWKFRDCVFRGAQVDAIVLHNHERVDFDGCEITDWGIRTHDGGVGQYVGGCAVFSWGLGGKRLRITNCDVYDGAGGLWLQDIDETTLTGVRVHNCTEFDLVGMGKLSVGGVNIFHGAVRVDVSGHNAELHGEEWILGLSVFADADGCNVYNSNPRNALMPGNIYLRPGPGEACVTIASHGAWAGVGDHPPECVLIDGGLMCDTNRKAAHAVLVVDAANGEVGPMQHVTVSNNNTGDKKQWREKPVQTERKGVTAVHNG